MCKWDPGTRMGSIGSAHELFWAEVDLLHHEPRYPAFSLFDRMRRDCARLGAFRIIPWMSGRQCRAPRCSPRFNVPPCGKTGRYFAGSYAK
jgi:hypothetical protein